MTLTSAISRTFLGSILAAALAGSAPPAYAQQIALGVDLGAAPEAASVIMLVPPSDVEGELVDPTCLDSVSCEDQSATLIWGQESPDKTVSWEIAGETIIWGQGVANTIIWGQ